MALHLPKQNGVPILGLKGAKGGERGEMGGGRGREREGEMRRGGDQKRQCLYLFLAAVNPLWGPRRQKERENRPSVCFPLCNLHKC